MLCLPQNSVTTVVQEALALKQRMQLFFEYTEEVDAVKFQRHLR